LHGFLITRSKYFGKKILKFDPSSQRSSFIDLGEGANDGGGWSGGALANDGCIYCVPTTANRVLKIDPASSSMSLVGDDVGGTQESIRRGYKWRGAVRGADSCIYGLPDQASSALLRIDTRVLATTQ